jgi:hypothetical protein
LVIADGVLYDSLQKVLYRCLKKMSCVAVPPTVEILGRYCFSGNDTMTECRLPPDSQLRGIDNCAFKLCSLTNISLPGSLQVIGESCFANSSSLEKVEFGDGSKLSEIGRYAFAGSAVASLLLPASLDAIPEGAFRRCKGLASVIFAGGCLLLGTFAFAESGIQGITIPETVTEIGHGGFWKCESLRSLAFSEPSALKRIGREAFSETPIQSLSLPGALEELGSSAFCGCTTLEFLSFGTHLRQIGASAFAGAAIQAVVIPATVTELGRRCLADCSKLTSVTFEVGSQVTILSDSTFSRSALASILVPRNVVVIAPSCFRECTALADVSFEEGSLLRHIQADAFSSSGISAFTLPPHTQTLGDRCFRKCRALKTFDIGADVPLKTIGPHAFTECAVKSLWFPRTVEFVSGSAAVALEVLSVSPENPHFVCDDLCLYSAGRTRLAACLGLVVHMTAPRTVEVFGEGCFADSRILRVVTFEKGCILKRIGDRAFRHSVIQTLTVPSSVEVLGKSCFAHCQRLQSIRFDVDGSLRRIEAKAFAKSGIKKILLPKAVESLDGSAFVATAVVEVAEGAKTFTHDSIYLIDAKTRTMSRCFRDDPDVEIPAFFEALGDGCFYEAANLHTLSFPTDGRLRSLGSHCLARTGIEFVVIPANVEVIGERCFYGCPSLREVQFSNPSRLLRIEAQAFTGTVVKSLSLPGSLQFVDGSALRSVDRLSVSRENRTLKVNNKFLVAPGSRRLVSEFGKSSEVGIPQRIESIGRGCFRDRGGLKTILFDQDGFVRRFEERSFASSTIASINVPRTLEVICKRAFQDCRSLLSVEFPERPRVSRIEEFAFWGSSLSNVRLPVSLAYIGGQAFPSDCDVQFASHQVPEELVNWRREYIDNSNVVLNRTLDDDLRDISEWLLHLEDWVFVRKLGAGAFGVVNCYRSKLDGSMIAIKDIRMGRSGVGSTDEGREDRTRLLFVREVEIMRTLDHPCVIKLRGVLLPTDTGQARIASEFMAGGSLDGVLAEQPSWWTATARAIVVAGIVLGMIYIHAQKVLHRDLKPGNILLDEEHRVKITDFGISRFSRKGLDVTGGIGTPLYMAPELIENDEGTAYNEKVDVYSFGLIFLEIVTGTPLPVPGGRQVGFFKHIRNVLDCVRPEIPKTVPDWVAQLIRDCWHGAPEERPTFPHIFQRLLEANFAILPDVDVAQVVRFLEWAAGKH